MRGIPPFLAIHPKNPNERISKGKFERTEL
jgi:hypothetical protein